MNITSSARSFRARVLPLIAATFCSVFLYASAAQAATFAAGDLVKLPDDGSLDTTQDSAVYYVGKDSKRYAFPNSQAYFTWYANFDQVKIVGAGELANLALAGNVTYRPGTRLVKITSDPHVYAVEPGGTLRWIQTEEVAKGLYGDLWNKRVDDISDAFFFNYQIGSPLSVAKYPEGSVVKRASDGALFLIEEGTKRKVSEQARTELRVQDDFVLAASGDLSEYPDSTELNVAEERLTDTAQKITAVIPEIPTLYVKPLPTSYINVGSGDVTLFGLRVASKNAVVIKRLRVSVEATTGPAVEGSDDIDAGGLVYDNNARPNFTRFRFLDAAGGEPFGVKESTVDFGMDQKQTFTFEGNCPVPAGTEKSLAFTAFTNYLLPTGEGYRVTILREGTQLVDATTGAAVEFAPSTDVVGPTLTTLNASMEVTPSAMPDKPVYVRGTNNADISAITFKATTVAPNIITSLTVQGYVDEEGAGGFLPGQDADNGSPTHVSDMLPQVSLYDAAGVKLGGPVAVTAAGKATFSNLRYAITAGNSADLHIRGDISKTVDIEAVPNRIIFDVADTADVTVTDDKGTPVGVKGSHNINSSPMNYATIRQTGSMTFAWAGNSEPVLVGTDGTIGTLTLTSKDDGYAVKTLSFTVAGEGKSLGEMRLEYPSGANTVTATGSFVGGHLTFSNLAAAVPKNGTLALKLLTKMRSRESGAVGGEVLAVSFDGVGPLQFVSESNGNNLDSSAMNVGTPASFVVSQNTASSAVVRYTLLSVKTEEGLSSNVYRASDTEVMRFTMQAAATGDAIIRKLTFQLSPQDYPKNPPENQIGSTALVNWAKLNGDFPDDNGVANLRLRVGNTSTVIGEDASAQIAYSIMTGGTRVTTPSTVTAPARGDYALLEYTFNPGSELKIDAGSLQHFAFELDTSQFDPSQDAPLTVTLLGGTDMSWSDVTQSSYAPLTGADASGAPLTSSVSVKY